MKHLKHINEMENWATPNRLEDKIKQHIEITVDRVGEFIKEYYKLVTTFPVFLTKEEKISTIYHLLEGKRVRWEDLERIKKLINESQIPNHRIDYLEIAIEWYLEANND